MHEQGVNVGVGGIRFHAAFMRVHRRIRDGAGA
jgi:hypothetical protein